MLPVTKRRTPYQYRQDSWVKGLGGDAAVWYRAQLLPDLWKRVPASPHQGQGEKAIGNLALGFFFAPTAAYTRLAHKASEAAEVSAVRTCSINLTGGLKVLLNPNRTGLQPCQAPELWGAIAFPIREVTQLYFSTISSFRHISAITFQKVRAESMVPLLLTCSLMTFL